MPNEFTLATMRGDNQSFEEFMLEVARDLPPFKGLGSPMPETVTAGTKHLEEQERIGEELRTLLSYTDEEWDDLAQNEFYEAERVRLNSLELATAGRERIQARIDEILEWDIKYGILWEIRQRALRLLQDALREGCDVEAFETPTQRKTGGEVKQRDLTILMQQYLAAGKRHNDAIDAAARATEQLQELRNGLKKHTLAPADA